MNDKMHVHMFQISHVLTGALKRTENAAGTELKAGVSSRGCGVSVSINFKKQN